MAMVFSNFKMVIVFMKVFLKTISNMVLINETKWSTKSDKLNTKDHLILERWKELIVYLLITKIRLGITVIWLMEWSMVKAHVNGNMRHFKAYGKWTYKVKDNLHSKMETLWLEHGTMIDLKEKEISFILIKIFTKVHGWITCLTAKDLWSILEKPLNILGSGSMDIIMVLVLYSIIMVITILVNGLKVWNMDMESC